MQCPRCKSTNVSIQTITETSSKIKHKSFLYWITIGWFVEPLLWLFLTIPKLLWELLKPRSTKTKLFNHAVCQNCGHSWKLA